MFKRRQKFREWKGAPQMDIGSPSPAIRASAETLTLAYRTQANEFAVVRFKDVHQHTFGYPNNEALGGHPVYSRELNFYAFNEVVDSPYLKELDRRNAVNFPHSTASFTELKHWFVPFHDETLEVVGGTPEFVDTIGTSSALEAIAYYDAH